MNQFEAKVLLTNLVSKAKSNPSQFSLTAYEHEAIGFAIDFLSPEGSQDGNRAPKELEDPGKSGAQGQDSPRGAKSGSDSLANTVKIDITVLSAPPPVDDARVCLDFGTAMSKAALVSGSPDEDSEEILVLPLGKHADQEEVSENMLISSVFIDYQGKLWFGKKAIDLSRIEGGQHLQLTKEEYLGVDNNRSVVGRMDNIKRRLAEAGLEEQVSDTYNPTPHEFTYKDIILAYLSFLTWAISNCLKELQFPKNLDRRFATPCLQGGLKSEVVLTLEQLLGQAQIVSDTLGDRIDAGIDLGEFLSIVRQIRSRNDSFAFIKENLTEPLGVAGSLVSRKSALNSLVMVVDVGAGTTDFSMFRLRIDPARSINTAAQLEGTVRVITEAGNHIDVLLREVILNEAKVSVKGKEYERLLNDLNLNIRQHKEYLFENGYLLVNLLDGTDVEIELDQFLSLRSVKKFEENLRRVATDVLESINESFLHWLNSGPPTRKLVVALTGGGSNLDMVKNLVNKPFIVHGTEVSAVLAPSFPEWLKSIDEGLEEEYPQTAVSIGGARKELIAQGGDIGITAEGKTHSVKLERIQISGV